MTPEKVQRLVPLVQKGALAISERLGFNHLEEPAPGIEDVRKAKFLPIEKLVEKE